MKRLLYILLISFGFSATAQNASTIQQLLDDGVTIGELLDSGITPEEFNGIEYEDGVIFHVDTLTGVAKIALRLSEYKTFQCNNGGSYPYTYSQVETSPDDGLQNTINIASICPGSVTGASFALNYISENGFEGWYIPTKNEIENVYQNLTLNYHTV